MLESDTSVATGIARVLSGRIVDGSLAPGARLRQDEIAAEFGVSHVPVREAFRKLEAQGLAVSLPRRGVRVSDLDPVMVREVTEMRAALEGLALAHAMPHMREADLEVARTALAEGSSSDEISAWEAANRRFHVAITAPCAMPRLMAAIADLHRSDARFLFATWKELDWEPRSDAEHRAILDAIVRRDNDGARALLEAHVREAGRALVQRLENANATKADAA
jgi:DNA-binding GntR family transcriptional regulator